MLTVCNNAHEIGHSSLLCRDAQALGLRRRTTHATSYFVWITRFSSALSRRYHRWASSITLLSQSVRQQHQTPSTESTPCPRLSPQSKSKTISTLPSHLEWVPQVSFSSTLDKPFADSILVLCATSTRSAQLCTGCIAKFQPINVRSNELILAFAYLGSALSKM